MRRSMMGVLGVVAMLASLAGSAMAQETKTVWKNDGKRYWRVQEIVKPFEMPKTQRIEAAEKQEGDFLGFKYTGKQMERVYFRDVPVATEVAAKGHQCTWRMTYEKKTSAKYHYCLENGVEQTCAGMSAAGECLGMKK